MVGPIHREFRQRATGGHLSMMHMARQHLRSFYFHTGSSEHAAKIGSSIHYGNRLTRLLG
jgi:hypothetical protein